MIKHTHAHTHGHAQTEQILIIPPPSLQILSCLLPKQHYYCIHINFQSVKELYVDCVIVSADQ